MKTLYLKHFYKIALLVLTLFVGGNSWGQTTFFSFTGTSDYLSPPATGWTSFGTTAGGSYLKLSPGSVTSPVYNAASSVVFKYDIASFGNGTTSSTKLIILDASTNTIINEYNLTSASSSTYTKDQTVNVGTIAIDFKVKIEGFGNGTLIKGTRLQNYSLVGTPSTSHTVNFDANGGTGTMAPQIASAAADLTLNTFTRTGYVFGGWNTAANGSGTAYTDGQEYDFSADLTLYAQWKPIITYDANGGENPPLAAVTALDGSHTISVPALMSRDNYDFAHWNTQADGNGTTYTPGATATFTTPTTLYAQWLLCAATVQSISPASGAPVGTEITIIVTADYFNEGVQYDLLFNDSTTPVQATATSDTTIKVTVPTDAKSGTLSISTEQGCPTLTTYTIITNDISGCE